MAIPLLALIPLLEHVVGIAADELARTKEPPAEVLAAFRRMSEVIVAANARAQGIAAVRVDQLEAEESEP